MKHRAKTATTALYANERSTLVCAGMFLLVAFSLYMYFLSVSVLNVVMREEIDGEIRKTNERLSVLESRYIAARTAITEETATARGFNKTTEKVYVMRTAPNLVLSGNDES